MSRSTYRARAGLALAGLAACLVGLAALFAGGGDAALPNGAACGPSASAAAVYAIDKRIADQIYENELSSTEVRADLGHITSSNALARAVASGNAKQVYAATYRIVYTPHWHIVRLRVLSSVGKLLADVGGPYIIAPLTGQITSGGSIVGSFVTSVQDDRGYKKLVTAIAGVPVEIYRGGTPLMGSISSPPKTPPASGSLTLNGVHYTVDAFDAEAFPTGTLRIAVFVPAPPAALSALPCPQVRLQVITAVVERVERGLTLANYGIAQHAALFVTQASEYAAGPLFVLRAGDEVAGTNELPASTAPAPPQLPRSGTVRYEGSLWIVSSFERFGPDRVYVLQPEHQRQPASGASDSTGTTASP